MVEMQKERWENIYRDKVDKIFREKMKVINESKWDTSYIIIYK